MKVSVLLHEVIVACKHCAPLVAKVFLLEQLTVLDALTVLLLLLFEVILIEARGLVQSYRLVPRGDRWLVGAQSAHQTKIVELVDVFACQGCDRTRMRRLVELRRALLVQRHFHQGLHSIPGRVHCPDRTFFRDALRRIDLESWHAFIVNGHAFGTAEAQTHHSSVLHQGGTRAAPHGRLLAAAVGGKLVLGARMH